MKKITLFVVLMTSSLATVAQFNAEPPWVLSVDELKAWTTTGPTADDGLIATQELLPRFENTDTQFNTALTNDMEIAYLPDGMSNFASYSEEVDQFNIYNFTNWAYIDKLIWFGGTASQNVQLPSAPWVNAAHKNGVKVLANIFFAPNVFGGTTATMQNFLVQDGNGDFVVIPIMVEMMEYYNFDGWFINEETDTNPSTAQLMYELLSDLTTEVEALGKEVMWYDAMLLNGNVNWQNRLNANNSPFVQNDEDGNSGNGFEQRVSSNIFINFFWNGTTGPQASVARANTISRSAFDVFMGVDVWPGRNQGFFETAGNTWMGWTHQNATSPYTSLGLFAPSCVYNNSRYSNFNNDPNDYANFYSQERHMFAGADRNPRLEDASGFKGYANWVPAGSTIQEIPFETNFNTGHGLKKFDEGTETSTSPWSNINDQDILPNWQFAFSDPMITGRWDFDLAYNGGSSLRLNGNLTANTPVDLLLYKTKLLLDTESKIDIIYNYNLVEDTTLELILTFADAPTQTVVLDVSPNGSTGWIPMTADLAAFQGRELATIGVRFGAATAVSNYILNIGNMRVHDDPPLSVQDSISIEDAIVISYPRRSNVIAIESSTSTSNITFEVYNVQGRKISSHRFAEGSNRYELSTTHLASGAYLLQFSDRNGTTTSKKIVVK